MASIKFQTLIEDASFIDEELEGAAAKENAGDALRGASNPPSSPPPPRPAQPSFPLPSPRSGRASRAEWRPWEAPHAGSPAALHPGPRVPPR